MNISKGWINENEEESYYKVERNLQQHLYARSLLCDGLGQLMNKGGEDRRREKKSYM